MRDINEDVGILDTVLAVLKVDNARLKDFVNLFGQETITNEARLQIISKTNKYDNALTSNTDKLEVIKNKTKLKVIDLKMAQQDRNSNTQLYNILKNTIALIRQHTIMLYDLRDNLQQQYLMSAYKNIISIKMMEDKQATSIARKNKIFSKLIESKKILVNVIDIVTNTRNNIAGQTTLFAIL